MSARYSINKAKTHLRRLLHQVRLGVAVTISDRGRYVARVVRIEAKNDLKSRLAALESSGVVTAPKSARVRIVVVARRPGALKRFLDSRNRF